MKHNEENERIKRAYRLHLKAACGLSDASIDVASAAIHRFEESTGFRSFKKFHFEQAIAFRRRLDEARNERTGKPLSKATALQILTALRAYFLWLAAQPGYRSRIRYSDADYFRLSEKDARVAKATKPRPVPTPEQIESVLERSPIATVIERRNRAIVAFIWLTGVRDGALVTLKLKHVDLANELVDQDPREVRTKNSKQLRTTFFRVGGSAQRIVEEWIAELRRDHLWGNDDPVFPATAIGQDSEQHFAAIGLARAHWASADAVQKIFKQLFVGIGLHGFNPHSFRHALAALGERTCQNPEQFKAWSQNLGHEGVLTTFSSYGPVSEQRQAELIKGLARCSCGPDEASASALAQAAIGVLRQLGVRP
ncbi:tyrosine-type recombinase/integrase [Bradyrhizobium sp. sGM-13]|uniref:tyrosine-type recombinase/integrase n=1 Tax=Bradyrhizobium sp. sGM-13 TaxID=2831781 RepID=UPI001BCC3B29|nr:tyrosine-type recombinase/integrase [Bradyrhizobium sp. sGM-13]